MSSCSNSSNILGNVNISDISNSGARLLMTHPLSGFSGGIANNIGEDGITAGDVIRYDVVPGSPSENKYTKAQADVAQHAEMIGIVENINGNSVTIVLSGQIQFPSSRFLNASQVATPTVEGASGGNDIYFLSEATAGAIQNLAPNVVGTIAKPVLQVINDNDGVFNGHVVNYIGYQIGGSINVEDINDDLTGTVAAVVDFGSMGTKLNFGDTSQWFALNQERWLPLSTYASEYTQWTYNNACDRVFAGGVYGLKEKVRLTTTPPSNWVGEKLTQKDVNGKIIGRWIVSAVDRPNNEIELYGVNVDSSSGLALNIDPDKNLYHGISTYMPDGSTSVTRLSFSLPIENKKSSSSFKDIFGGIKQYNVISSMFVNPDGGYRGASIAHDVTVKNLTATDKITITSMDNDTTATDVAYILKQMNTDLASCMSKVGLTKTNVNIT
jgi:hypothetical protein